MAAKKEPKKSAAPAPDAKASDSKKGPAKASKSKPAPAGDSKFAQLLAAKKVDPRRVVSASHVLEGLEPEDRAIRLAKRNGKKEGASEADKAEKRKPRSGRPITPRALEAVMKGAKISGPAKQRFLKAVNHVLEQKKQEKVELKALF
jgi:hypothetical protein